MMRVRTAGVAVLGFVAACERPPRPAAEPPNPQTVEHALEGPEPRDSSAPMGTGHEGTTCARSADCGAGQQCIESVCRAMRTSIAGEILARAADSLAQAGDWRGAATTYAEASAAFARSGAPVPAGLECGHATVLLWTARTAEEREAGAARADACLRAAPPGSALRVPVLDALGQLRHQGLDLAAFDQAAPAGSFFTRERSAPTVDSVTVEAILTPLDQPTVEEVRTSLATPAITRAIAECFLQAWGTRHEAEERASFSVRYAVRLRDMGDYDVFTPELIVTGATAAEDGFEPCVATALSASLSVPRAGRVTAWQTTLDVVARVRG